MSIQKSRLEAFVAAYEKTVQAHLAYIKANVDEMEEPKWSYWTERGAEETAIRASLSSEYADIFELIDQRSDSVRDIYFNGLLPIKDAWMIELQAWWRQRCFDYASIPAAPEMEHDKGERIRDWSDANGHIHPLAYQFGQIVYVAVGPSRARRVELYETYRKRSIAEWHCFHCDKKRFDEIRQVARDLSRFTAWDLVDDLSRKVQRAVADRVEKRVSQADGRISHDLWCLYALGWHRHSSPKARNRDSW